MSTGYQSHKQPGRRFAQGSSRGDQLLGTFGFAAHALLFFGLGALCSWLRPDWALWLAILTLAASAVLLAVRGAQVGLSTTRESIAAIRDAWLGR